MRVPQFLTERQIPFETILHPPAFSARKRAKYLHLPGRQVAKCVLLAGPHGYVLAVLPATHRVDIAAVAAALNSPLRLARLREIVETFRDCEWGVVPPSGALYGLATVLDETLNAEAMLVFQGHTHGEAIRLRCSDFERLEQARRLRFARLSPEAD